MFVMDGEAAPELETALEEKCTVKTAKAGAGVPKAWVVQNIKSWEIWAVVGQYWRPST